LNESAAADICDLPATTVEAIARSSKTLQTEENWHSRRH